MTDVDFPHTPLTPASYAPALYLRDGTPAAGVPFDQVWADHGVAYTTITNADGTRATVSTLFLGLDHRLPGDTGAPILFETAVFDGTGLVFRARSRSEQAAREAHVSALIDLVAVIGRETRPHAPSPAPVEDLTVSDSLPETEPEGTPDDRDDDTPKPAEASDPA